jgi:mRNA interferase HicA
VIRKQSSNCCGQEAIRRQLKCLVHEQPELKKYLAGRGCTFETHRGGSGHLTVRRGDRKTQLPMHGSGKELGKGLVNKILKDLALK